MANNAIPQIIALVLTLATKMLQGLITLGATLKITQILPDAFKLQIDAMVSADNDFNAARSVKQAASDVFKPADAALTSWEQVTRNILAGRFGNRWSTMWAQAGFTATTTSVPTRIADRLALALKLENFFKANPTFEVASMEVTAAQAKLLREAAEEADKNLTAANVDLKNKGDVWDTAYAALTGTMRALVSILTATLAKDDPRWLTFGLDMPSTNTTPGQPTDVVVTTDDSDNLVVQCTMPARAVRLRWRMLIVGLETEYRLVARSVDPIATIPGALPGQTVQLIVQAVNEAGSQGVASEPVQFTMPLVAGKAAASEPQPVAPAAATRLLDEIVIPSNGNGHANGNRLPALT